MKKLMTIIHTNDIHSAFDGNDIDRIGFAKLKTYVDSVRKECEADGSTMLFVDAGDMIEETPLYNFNNGKDLYPIIDAMGYDIMIPGNHDFDYGWNAFLERARYFNRGMSVPPKYVFYREILNRDARRKYGLESNILAKIKNGYTNRILKLDDNAYGFFGIAISDIAMQKTNKKLIEGIAFPSDNCKYDNPLNYDDPIAIENADAKIFKFFISHMGYKDKHNVYLNDKGLSDAKQDINLIISAHNHKYMDDKVRKSGCVVVSAGKYLRAFGRVDVYLKSNGKGFIIDNRLFYYDDMKDIEPDPTIQEMIKAVIPTRTVTEDVTKNIGNTKELFDDIKAEIYNTYDVDEESEVEHEVEAEEEPKKKKDKDKKSKKKKKEE